MIFIRLLRHKKYPTINPIAEKFIETACLLSNKCFIRRVQNWTNRRLFDPSTSSTAGNIYDNGDQSTTRPSAQ